MTIGRYLILGFCTVGFMGGCAGESIRTTSLTPAEFVGAVKQVSAHNDLADFSYTARALGLTLIQDREPMVYDPVSGELLGRAISAHPDTLPTRFSRMNFEYRTFYPENESGHRTRFILTLNPRSFCVRRNDVSALFGQPDRPERSAHSDIDGFSYSSAGSLRIYFAFSLNQECLTFISSFQDSVSGGK
jgi:hypothetical protein